MLWFVLLGFFFSYILHIEAAKNSMCGVEGVSVRTSEVSNVQCFLLNVCNINICEQTEH